MMCNKRDFLAGFDYFATRIRPGTHPDDRNARVVQWALAWPDLAPHVTQLLYDAEHHVRHELGDDFHSIWIAKNGMLNEWTAVSATHFSPSLTAFEAAIVYHAVIRPDGPSLKATFYRGNDSYVVNGVDQGCVPCLPGEKTIGGDFPCDVHRAVRVRTWILRQQSRDPTSWWNEHSPHTNATSSGLSDAADGETLFTIDKATTYFCPT